MAMARIIAGCYEEMILCYDMEEGEGEEVEEEEEEEGDDKDKIVRGENKARETGERKFRLKLSFTDHPHSGSVRCIAASKGGMVASGSNDETIHVYNANTGRDVGSLMSHGGSVTSLQFHGAKYLFSGSEDATAVVWKTKPWEVLKTLRGHKGPIESVAVHPSGKIALSTGKDRSLKTWNLIKGRSAYVTNIKQEGSLVRWSPSGKYYALVLGASSLRVYDVSTAAVVFSHDHRRQINALRFLSDDLVVFGGEGKALSVASVEKKAKIVANFDAHETRIRDLCVIEMPEETKINENWIVTGSNDGWIKVWKLIFKKGDAGDENEKDDTDDDAIECKLICEVNSGVRISCLCSYVKKRPGEGKKNNNDDKIKTKEDDDDEEKRKEDDDLGNNKAEGEEERVGAEVKKGKPKKDKKGKTKRGSNVDNKTNSGDDEDRTKEIKKVKFA